MATNITTTGSTPVVLRQRQHTALSLAACLCCVSPVVPSFRLVEGRYLPVPAVTPVHGVEVHGVEVHGVEAQGVDRRGPIMSHLQGITMSGRPMTAPWSSTITTSTTLKSINDQASDFGGHRGSDATDGKFSTRSGFRSCSPPV